MGGRIGRQNSQFLTFFDFQIVITQRQMLQISSSSALKQPFFVRTEFIHKINKIQSQQKIMGGRVGRQKSKNLTFFDFQIVITQRQMLQIS